MGGNEGEILPAENVLEEMTARLSAMQLKFCEALLGEANGSPSLAARIAGYAGDSNSMKNIACRVMRHPSVRRYIHERVRRQMRADEVLQILADHARGSMEDFISINEETGAPTIDLLKAAERGQLHLIKKLKNGKDGVEIELYDAQSAAALICRNLGLFNDQMKLSVRVDQVLDSLPEDLRDGVRAQLAELISEMPDE